MQNYRYVFFDLDGTLTDPQEGITRSVAHALRQYGIEVEDLTELKKFIGPPLKDSFMRYYGFGEKQAEEAIEKYREYFKPIGMFENAVYPGIPQLLEALRAAGKTLAVATSKPGVFARKILEHFGLLDYFVLVSGSDLDGSKSHKSEVILYALQELGIEDPAQVIMVGDRDYDVLGARETGMDCIGVLFGYGDREEMENAGAAYIAETVQDLQELLLG